MSRSTRRRIAARSRSTPEHAHLPVIVATARVLSEDERHRLQTNAQHIIEKQSHTRQQLLEMISDQITTMVSAEPSDEQGRR